MSTPDPRQPDDAVIDLLIKHITEGLSPAEQREFDVLDSAQSSSYRHDLERAAAAVSLAAATQDPLPPALRLRLQQQADSHCATLGQASRSARVPRRSRWSASSGWLAAAACLLLAVAGWYRSPAPVVVAPVAQSPPVAPVAPVAPAPSLAEQRAALLAKQGAIQIPLGATKDPAAAGVVGDVVWDPATQTGFMRFVGLAANDPKVRQYQIWIFDGSRDKRYPVDGGIFDVPASAGEIVVPIHAGVPVRVAAAFAVTVEKPGGVVVSSRAHVVALGAKS